MKICTSHISLVILDFLSMRGPNTVTVQQHAGGHFVVAVEVSYELMDVSIQCSKRLK